MHRYPTEATARVVQPFISGEGLLLNQFRQDDSYIGIQPPAQSPFWGGIMAAHAEGLTGKGQTIAVLDTGMMSDHPTIKARLRQSVTMVGGSPEDARGHGAVVALIALLAAPDASLVNVKCSMTTVSARWTA